MPARCTTRVRSKSISSLHRDGRPVAHDLRWGVYVAFEAPNDYAAALLPANTAW